MRQIVAFNVKLIEIARLPPATGRAALPVTDKVTAQIH